MQQETEKMLQRIKYIVDTHHKGNQAELADICGIRSSTFNNYYRALSVPSYDVLVRIYNGSKKNVNPIWFWLGLGEPGAMTEEDMNKAIDKGMLDSMAKNDHEELVALRKAKDFLTYKVDSLEKYIQEHIDKK